MQTSAKVAPQSGYRNLVAYKKSEVIQQGVEIFCNRFMGGEPSSSQEGMVAKALRCKQSIIDGSNAAATSASREMEYTSAARDALDELKADVFEYLHQKGVEALDPASAKAQAMRDWSRRHDEWEDWKAVFETRDDITLCNVMLTVISQTSYLLKRLIFSQEEEMRSQSGVRGRMARGRTPPADSDWSKAVFAYLEASENESDLVGRCEKISVEVKKAYEHVAAHRGWSVRVVS